MRVYQIILVLLFSCSLGLSQDLDQNLLLHYSFDGNAIDESGNSYDGIESNVTYVEDRNGVPNSACHFNGFSSFIDFPNVSNLKPELPVSFAFWIRYDSDDFEDRALFNTSFEEDVNSGVHFTSQSSTGKYAVGYGDGSNGYSSDSRRSYVSDSQIETGVWHHVAIVVNGPTNMEIYIDCDDFGGTHSGTGSGLQYSVDPGTIGRHDQNTQGVLAYYFNGVVDEFRYWDRALTEDDILLLCSDLTLDIVNLSNPLCTGNNNGSIEVIAEGGVEPYEYSIDGNTPQSSGVFTGLSSGVYEITATDDNGNAQTIEVELFDPALLQLQLVSSSNPNCSDSSDGSISVTASGGTSNGTYSFSIDNGPIQSFGTFNNLPSGSYTISVTDDNDCVSSLDITLTTPLDMVIRTASTPESCETSQDGTITIDVLEGTPDYTYSLDGFTFQDDNIFDGLAAGSYLITVMDSNGCTAEVTVTVDSEVPFSFFVTNIMSASCIGSDDGSVTVLASGTNGVAVYSIDGIDYSTNNIFEGLSPGSYIVFASDDTGCVQTVEIEILEGETFTVELETVNVSCNGLEDGSIEVIINDDNNYTYSLDGINYQSISLFENLVADTYTVTVVNELGCESQVEANITEPVELLVETVTISNPTCNGSNDAMITFSASGGTPNYLYTLNGVTQTESTFIGLGAGDFELVVVDDNGCLFTDEITIEAPEELVITITNIEQASCNGGADGSVTVTTNSQNTITYTLDNSSNTTGEFTGLQGGVYEIFASDEMGCESQISFSIDEESSISIVDVESSSTSCQDSQDGIIVVNAIGGEGELVYSLNDGPFQSSNTFENLDAGFYTIAVSDESNCTIMSSIDLESTEELSIFFEDIVNVDCNDLANGSFSVLALGGTPPYTTIVDGIQSGSTVTDLNIGFYAIEVTDANGCAQDTVIEIVGEGEIIYDSLIVNNISCYNESDGSIMVSTTGSDLTFTLGELSNTTGIFTDLMAGDYTLDMSHTNGCTSQVTFSITEPDPLEIVIAESNISTDSDGYIEVDAFGGVGPYRFSDDGVSYEGDSIFTDLMENTHTIWVLDSNDCLDSVSVTLTDIAKKFIDLTQLDIFPIPAQDHITLSLEINRSQEIQLEFFTMQGESIYHHGLVQLVEGSNTIVVNTNDIPSGIYLLKLSSAISSYSEKVIIVD